MRPLNRILINMALDGTLAAIGAPLARWLADPRGGLLHPLWFVAGGAITLLVGGVPFRVQQQYWRFSGVADLLAIAGGSVASAVLFALLLLATGFSLPTPTFPIIHALVLLVLLGGLRIVYRLSQGRPFAGRAGTQRVLLLGKDEAADLFIRAVRREQATPLRVVGLLARGRHQPGRRIHGVPILGTMADLPTVLERLVRKERGPDGLVIADPDLRGEELAGVLRAAEAHGITVGRVPDPTALSPAARVELRPVAIEDLLNRPPVSLDQAGLSALVCGRRVLVTGAGGSIGSELARQLAALLPSELVLLDHGEFALWQIEIELAEKHPGLVRFGVVADIRDAERLRAVFETHRPQLVFHAAALKHVPIVEANPGEGMLTNIVGTRQVADAAQAVGTDAMVLISTDKAVNPSSLMGASKRAAEMYCQALDVAARRDGGMRCITVRFGNVLGSTGSVVPLFRRQLEHGGPLTVTHPDMQRYFMTVPEAVSLVLQASALGDGAITADGGIFVLDMGQPVKIVDLARQMIRLAGLQPGRDIEIRFTGLRPGEKLFEELFHGSEAPVPTGQPGLLIATPRMVDLREVGAVLDGIALACRAGRHEAAIQLLHRLVPEFRHNPLGLSRTEGASA
ncbi:polysaccharide biosynthesis protein [Acetobacteraceae bacterium KSS8]|uniref:Polysaccharide biosynthesis protein n=1 Tax=Endosaccharibacter trunci TaxID=2812733 RepID=A0ABT1W2Z3_9PROT|nr:polysaccharide biosynthesis protein [Acetobacteraceae bacterium KSS8]